MSRRTSKKDRSSRKAGFGYFLREGLSSVFVHGFTSAAAVTVKAKTVQADGIEWTAELRLPVNAAGETGFVNQIQQVAGVRSAVLVSYNGEYLG